MPADGRACRRTGIRGNANAGGSDST